MIKVIGLIILIVIITALLIYRRYSGFKAIQSKSKTMMYPFYLRIGIRSAVLLLGLYLLWEGQLTESWPVAGLIYILCSIIILILLLQKVEAWRKSQENK